MRCVTLRFRMALSEHMRAVIAFLALIGSGVSAADTAVDNNEQVRDWAIRVHAEMARYGYLGRKIAGFPNDELTAIGSRYPSLPQAIGGVKPYRFTIDEQIGFGYESAGRLFLDSSGSVGQGKGRGNLYVADGDRLQKFQFGLGDLQYVEFQEMKPEYAILEVSPVSDIRTSQYYKVAGGIVARTAQSGDSTHTTAPWRSGAICTSNHSRSGTTLVSIQDAATLRTLQLLPERTLRLASGGANADSNVFVRCHSVAGLTVIWMTTGGREDNGVTYILRGQELVPVFDGAPVVATDHYLLFRDAVQVRQGTLPVNYALFHTP